MDPFNNPFRALLAEPGIPLGTWLMSGTASTAEAMGCIGFDWLVVDMEHVPIDYKDAYHILQAIAGTKATPVIRLAWFFCYLDQRIRNECWDLQLQFRAEAARLEELAG